MSVLLLDADGVIFKKGEYFSTRFARDQDIPESEVVDFFKTEFRVCQAGKADLREAVYPYLSKWKWSGTVDEFLTHWFQSDCVFDEESIEGVQNIRQSGISCYLASNNEKYRAEFLEKLLTEKHLLDGYFFSARIGMRKNDPGFFTHILSELRVLPSETFFVDNEQENVDVATSVGIRSWLYKEGVLADICSKV